MNWAPLLEDLIREEIPLSRAMGLQVMEATRERVRLYAPLAPNDNHKQTGFGGSLYSMAVLAGWGLAWVNLKAANLKAHIVIAKSSEAFLRPATADLESGCAANAQDFNKALSDLEISGKARVNLQCQVMSNKIECMRFRGTYALVK